LPALEVRHPATLLPFLRDPWWVAGVALQTAGYGLYLWSLRGAPLSVVHTALTGGIAFFVVLAVAGLGERMRALEWCGIAGVVSGLVFLALSLTDEGAGSTDATGVVPFSVLTLLLAGLA
jgi:drug/metabolite transporter (DMT)-like permease